MRKSYRVTVKNGTRLHWAERYGGHYFTPCGRVGTKVVKFKGAIRSFHQKGNVCQVCAANRKRKSKY